MKPYFVICSKGKRGMFFENMCILRNVIYICIILDSLDDQILRVHIVILSADRSGLDTVESLFQKWEREGAEYRIKLFNW